jgi:hypothetical protein
MRRRERDVLDRLEDFGCLDVWRLAALLFFVVVDGSESNQWWVLGCFYISRSIAALGDPKGFWSCGYFATCSFSPCKLHVVARQDWIDSGSIPFDAQYSLR